MTTITGYKIIFVVTGQNPTTLNRVSNQKVKRNLVLMTDAVAKNDYVNKKKLLLKLIITANKVKSEKIKI